MPKKNNSIIIIVAILILAVIAIIVVKNRKIEQPQSLSQTDIQIDQAVKSDTTTEIGVSLDNINLDDSTGSDDLKTVDQELEKL